MTPTEKFNPEMLVEVDPQRTDAFFYAYQDIASVSGKTKDFLLIAVGDVRIRIDDDYYDNSNLDDAITDHDLTDVKLADLEREGRLEWMNNNWFEVVWSEKGSDVRECDIGDVAFTIKEALELLKVYWEDDQ